ncbi:MAG: tol-pal system protein YbgF [Pseudomonadota bacterium]
MSRNMCALYCALGLSLGSPSWAYARDVEVVQGRPVYVQHSSTHAQEVPSRRIIELQEQVDGLQQELQVMRGQLEEQNWHLKQLQEQNKRLYQNIEQRLAEKSAQPELESPQTTASDDTSPAITKVALTTPVQTLVSEQEAYQAAYERLQARDYPGALVAFRAFVGGFPKSEYTANAHYWLGEVYLLTGDLESADAEFTQVALNNTHQKASDALLKRGYVQYTKKNWSGASAYFNDVRTRFPGSAAARLAEARLQHMREEGRV